MPTLSRTPDKKLFSDLLEFAGDYHVLERAFVLARRSGTEPPSLEELLRAITEVKLRTHAEVEPSRSVPDEAR